MIKYFYSILFLILLGTQFIPTQYFYTDENKLVQMVEEINETSSNQVEVKEVHALHYFLQHPTSAFVQFIISRKSIDYWIGNENLKMDLVYQEKLRPPRFYFV